MLLINNSGFGAYGEFPAPGVDHTLKMIDVNVRAPVELTGRLWDELKARGGMVATVASLAGFQPTPLMTTYAATKSFMLDWSVALDAEARRHGIRCVAICPGPVSTNFSKAAGFASSTGLGGQTSDECADEAVRGMAAARPVVVTGWKHKILAVFSARLPKPWAAAIGLRMIQRLRLDRFVKKAWAYFAPSSSSRACESATLLARSPSMRASSDSRSLRLPWTGAISTVVDLSSCVLVTTRWACPRAATCGRCVTQKT